MLYHLEMLLSFWRANELNINHDMVIRIVWQIAQIVLMQWNLSICLACYDFPVGSLVLGFSYILCAQSMADFCGLFINKNFFSYFTVKCFFKLCHDGHCFQILCSWKPRFHWFRARICNLREKKISYFCWHEFFPCNSDHDNRKQGNIKSISLVSEKIFFSLSLSVYFIN